MKDKTTIMTADELMMARVKKLQSGDGRLLKRGLEYGSKVDEFCSSVERGILEIKDAETGLTKRCEVHQKIRVGGRNPMFCMNVYVDGRFVYKENWQAEELYRMVERNEARFASA